MPSKSATTGVAAVFAAAVIGGAAFFVKPFEGRELAPYRDIVGVLTVCEGHTGRSTGTKIENRRYTDAECDTLLQGDVGVAFSHVQRCLPSANLNQAIALTSAVFNLGPAVACDSTLRRYADAGDWDAACRQLPRWNRAGGVEVRGLTRRRTAEMDLCLTPPR